MVLMINSMEVIPLFKMKIQFAGENFKNTVNKFFEKNIKNDASQRKLFGKLFEADLELEDSNIATF